ncbi:tyrosine decarboxylase MfnA [Haloarchaeobius sp. DYHT-AS-18]|uniref:tyrosine decarboxylase MfnA n=1 Tax=Haloarchaeobius sp. DYHT-AS-18 TaxID=3446117 RepID=UPI003EBBE368
MRGQPQDFDRVLSSMCTPPHPVAREAAERFLATNPGDPATYQTVADLEDDAVAMLGDIVGLDDPAGYIASGGTEANIQAVRMARNRSVSSDPNVVVPESAHFSFQKAADVLAIELRIAPLTDDYTVDLGAVKRFCDEDTAGIVGVAGSTEYGRVDPIPELANIAHRHDALLHVDAAWGGFLLPFTDHDWHFGHAGVDTLTIDPHKMGQAAIPAGGLLAREDELFDALAVDTPYLESAKQATLTGTRSGAGVASAAAAMQELWPDGYREQYETSVANADFLVDALRERGFDVVEPDLPIVTADVSSDLFEALREEGWRVSTTGSDEMRVVMMPHVTREMLSAFLQDIDRLRPTVNINT